MAGVVILVHPRVGIAVFSLLFAVWFIAHCISRLAGLSRVRLAAGRGMYCFALALNLIGLVAGILLAVMPFSAAAVLGYLAALYLIALGVESVAMAFFLL